MEKNLYLIDFHFLMTQPEVEDSYFFGHPIGTGIFGNQVVVCIMLIHLINEMEDSSTLELRQY